MVGRGKWVGWSRVACWRHVVKIGGLGGFEEGGDGEWRGSGNGVADGSVVMG